MFHKYIVDIFTNRLCEIFHKVILVTKIQSLLFYERIDHKLQNILLISSQSLWNSSQYKAGYFVKKFTKIFKIFTNKKMIATYYYMLKLQNVYFFFCEIINKNI